MHTYKLKFHTVNKERQKLKMKTKRVEMPSLYWQHVDGSFCVKPLKQKQVVSTAAFFFSSAFTPLFTTTAVVPSNTKAARYFEVAPLRPTSCLFHWFPLTLQVDGVSYLLQEIYGIENKYNSQESKVRRSEELPVCSSLSDCISEEKLFSLVRFDRFDCAPACRWPTTRSATTAPSVWCACRTCATRSFCPADTCVSATPAQTRCATRPTAAPSAGCVSSQTL